MVNAHDTSLVPFETTQKFASVGEYRRFSTTVSSNNIVFRRTILKELPVVWDYLKFDFRAKTRCDRDHNCYLMKKKKVGAGS